MRPEYPRCVATKGVGRLEGSVKPFQRPHAGGRRGARAHGSTGWDCPTNAARPSTGPVRGLLSPARTPGAERQPPCDPVAQAGFLSLLRLRSQARKSKRLVRGIFASALIAAFNWVVLCESWIAACVISASCTWLNWV